MVQPSTTWTPLVLFLRNQGLLLETEKDFFFPVNTPLSTPKIRHRMRDLNAKERDLTARNSDHKGRFFKRSWLNTLDLPPKYFLSGYPRTKLELKALKAGLYSSYSLVGLNLAAPGWVRKIFAQTDPGRSVWGEQSAC